MFTGLVEGRVPVVARREERGGLWLELDLGTLAEGVQLGDSIAVAGVCLTVVHLKGSCAAFELSPETLSLTKFREIELGQECNIERSLRAGDRLGGHFVSGHVDACGEFLSATADGAYQNQEFRAPATLAPLLIHKGSVCVDGVSLTIASRPAADRFTVALIPETLERTTLGHLHPGDRVHLEGDLLGKFVLAHLERMTEAGVLPGPQS